MAKSKRNEIPATTATKRSRKPSQKVTAVIEAAAGRIPKRKKDGKRSGPAKSLPRASEGDGTRLEFVEPESEPEPQPEPEPSDTEATDGNQESDVEDGDSDSGTPENKTVVIGPNVKYLKKLEPEAVKDWVSSVRSLRASGYKNSALSLIEDSLKRSITQKVTQKLGLQKAARWKHWSSSELLKFMEKAYPTSGESQHTIEHKLKARINFKRFRPDSVRTADAINQELNELIEQHPEVLKTTESQAGVCKRLFQLLKAQNLALYDDMMEGGEPKDIDAWSLKFLQKSSDLSHAVSLLKPHGYGYQQRNEKDTVNKNNGGGKKRLFNGGDSSDREHKKSKPTAASNHGEDSSKPPKPICNHCGWKNHKASECSWHKQNDPDHNPEEKVAWSKSAAGKAWKKIGKEKFDSLARRPLAKSLYDEKIEGTECMSCLCDYTVPCIDKCIPCNNKPAGCNKTSFPIYDNGDYTKDSTLMTGENIPKILSAFNSNDDYTLPATIITSHNDISILFLLDIGALQGNYISLDLATALEAQGIPRKKCSQKVCSAMSNFCKETYGKMSFYIQYYNVYECRYERLQIVAKVLDIQFDLIIGLPTIKLNNLVTEKFAYLFSSGITPVCADLTSPARPTGTAHSTSPNVVLGGLVRDSQLDAVQPGERIGKFNVFTDCDPDDDGMEDTSSPEPWDETPLPTESDELDLVYIEGDDITKTRIREFLELFRDRFSRQLRPEPAKIPPMELSVDVETWDRNPANHRPPRRQSDVKQAETLRQVEDMIKHKVIRPCSTPISSYSQVLLTPKPNRQYRFCVDYRNLNLVTKSPVWPIPLIQATIERLGGKRPKFFAVMDLTKGYYQAPLAESSRHYTAFITLAGMYEWLRVPMGLKGAPAYFQRIMATVVLAGLVYKICEIYLDDVIVYAQTIDELIDNLTQVFERFRKHNITLNPEKCRFGMTETEYVGRVINSEGWKFSEEKKAEVLNFRIPQRLGELKSFIGLCEYFHSHIRHFSEIMKPLHEALHGYSKKFRHTRLKLTEEQLAAFQKVQEEITQSAMLYFMDDTAPVFLQTDASDYGIGAYLFQRVNGEDRPVAILSKTLERTQLRWSTPEKEGYAIYYALKKFDYLLRDVRFTLQTDHKNLIYINDTASPKLVRWKLAIQEFDFDIEYIEGAKNFIADGFSRFCQFLIREEEEPTGVQNDRSD